MNRRRTFPDADTRNPQKGKVRQNEYGFNIGGPVSIPKLYNGRNKTFFYFTENWYRQANAFSTGIGTVATNLMRQGNFTELGSKVIYDPSTTATVNGAVTAVGTVRTRMRVVTVTHVYAPSPRTCSR